MIKHISNKDENIDLYIHYMKYKIFTKQGGSNPYTQFWKHLKFIVKI